MRKSTALELSPVLAHRLSVGIDLGGEESHFSLVDRAGDVACRGRFAMRAEEVQRTFAGVEGCVMMLEACNQSGWVARLLRSMGHHVIVANPRKLKMISASHMKTDKLDAEILGRLARLAQLDPKELRSVSIRTAETELLRGELRVREQLVATRSKFIALARSIVRGQGLPLPRSTPDTFAANLEAASLPEAVRVPLAQVLPLITHVTGAIAKMDCRLVEIARKFPAVKRLVEIDGVGLVTSLAFVLCIEDPLRFARSREVGPYLGLVPIVRQSSNTERRGPITKAGDSGVRRLLVQAAHTMLRTKKESALKTWGLAVTQRRGKKKAVVALARKLATVMHRVWVSDSAYARFPAPEVTA